MTRKDYVEVSEILRGYAEDIDPDTFETLLLDFIDFFKSDNKNFNETIFRNAVFA